MELCALAFGKGCELALAKCCELAPVGRIKWNLPGGALGLSWASWDHAVFVARTARHKVLAFALCLENCAHTTCMLALQVVQQTRNLAESSNAPALRSLTGVRGRTFGNRM